MSRNLVWNFISTFTLIACAENGSSSTKGVVDPTPLVLVEPADLTTSASGRLIKLVVGFGEPISNEVLARLRERVSVTTSEGDTVPILVSIDPVNEDLGGERRRTLGIELSWSALKSVWHQVEVDLNGLRGLLEPHPSLLEESANRFVSRFLPGPMTLLRSVSLCSTESASKFGVRFEFTELLDYVPAPSTLPSAPIHAAIDNSECAILPNITDEELASNLGATIFQFNCGTSSDVPSRLSLALSREMRGLDGQTLKLPVPGLRFELPIKEGYTFGECTMWRLAIPSQPRR